MRPMMPPDCVDERHVAYEPVLVAVAAIVERLIAQILPDHRHEDDIARVGVD